MPQVKRRSRRSRRSRRGGLFGNAFKGSFVSDLCRNSKYLPLAKACNQKHNLKQLQNTLSKCGSNVSVYGKKDGISAIPLGGIAEEIAHVQHAAAEEIALVQKEIDQAKLDRAKEQMEAKREKKAAARGLVGGRRKTRRRRRKTHRRRRRRKTRRRRRKR